MSNILEEHEKDIQRLKNKHYLAIKRLQKEIEELEDRLKTEFDTGYKMGVKEGLAALERLKKSIN